MLVLSQSTFAFQNFLTLWNTRWKFFAMGSDSRTEKEFKEKRKPRTSTINFYISNNKFFKKHYNDLNPQINKEFKEDLKGFLEK